MSRDATEVINTCAKFEVDMTYRTKVRPTTFSIDRQLKVPIFTFSEAKGSNFKFHVLTAKKHFLGGNDA